MSSTRDVYLNGVFAAKQTPAQLASVDLIVNGGVACVFYGSLKCLNKHLIPGLRRTGNATYNRVDLVAFSELEENVRNDLMLGREVRVIVVDRFTRPFVRVVHEPGDAFDFLYWKR